ncbi:ATP-binding protein [Deinococcus pimensis]|uniref:ATP-binding protein n=1 Tax=Deinococcus pimensis TaxID=309888 RepID=UPI0004853E4C|nr:ATP-binding protein [Deinococcus pimensis]
MFPRFLSSYVTEAMEVMPAVLITGARQVGKSTLAADLVPLEAHYSLDDLDLLASAREDPVGFVNALPSRVLIDEIQRAPELMLPIKASIDRDRRPGRFVLTGSANVLTLPRVSDSLAGRMSVHRLWPLSQGETSGEGAGPEDFVGVLFGSATPAAATPDDLVKRVLRGGYPDAVGQPTERRRALWYDAYVTTILQRDVRDLSRVTSVTEFPRLLALLAMRAGKLLNATDLARDLGSNNVTTSRYVDLLRAVYLVDTLPAWATNVGKRLIKAPKVYFPDTGLAAHVLGVTEERAAQDRPVLGPLLENFVTGEIARQLGWSSVRASLHHYRTASGQEVDLVLETPDGRVCAVEVKSSVGVKAADFRGLEALAADLGPRFHRGVVLYAGQRVLPFGERMLAVPIGALWQWR